ncbi:TRAF family member-associated NF-kappa-B activator [Cricetulus griseus]|uniref:TRAF family member-associated NF-kappa-B activator n=1 Tax=Cricetulus griseus TaxID=10029 RepID=G3I180_CRIGR|nr:TRAF family member-associated NF-kappa-B activator [Cricetulus griseus]
MDKNIGEQLNRAYEAFRQACMDRDSAVKELQQKTETYEQRIREQQEQLSLQQTLIDKLKSQLLLVDSCRDNSYGYVPLLEDSERRKNNLTLDEPHDKLKLGTLRNKQSKCTDKTEKQEALFKPQAKDDRNRGTPCIESVVTPRGLGRDEEDTSLESLSKFNVKFPPMDSDSAFLHSTPETPNIHTPATSEAVCQDRFNMEVRDNPGNFGKTEETLFEIRRIDPITSAIENLKITDKTKPSNLRAPCLPAGDHNVFYVNKFPLQDPPDAPLPSLDSPGKAVRGPQQKRNENLHPPKGETKKKFKDPNAPKRPPSAFFLFCSEYRPKFKGEHPGLSIGDVAKKLGEMWNNTAADDKQPYEKKAAKLKEKHEKDIAAYRAKGKPDAAKNGVVKAEKIKKKKEEEDEEEENEEDEEEKEEEEDEDEEDDDE